MIRNIKGKNRPLGYSKRADPKTGIITYKHDSRVTSDKVKEHFRKKGYPANQLEAQHERNKDGYHFDSPHQNGKYLDEFKGGFDVDKIEQEQRMKEINKDLEHRLDDQEIRGRLK